MVNSMKLGLTGLLAAAGLLTAAAMGQGTAQADAPAARPAMVEDFVLPDQNLLARQLYRMGDAKAVVLITYASGDAAVRAEAPGWMALKAAYAPRGVEFLMLASKLGETRPKVNADAKAAGLDMPILFDYQQLIGEGLGVTRAAEVIIIDPRTWTVAYRGAATGAAGEAWAKTAIEGLVSGAKVAMAPHAPRGAAIAFPERGKAASFAKISYAKTIAPIIEKKCATCHQPGGIGPMTLTNYEMIKGFSPMIREVIRTDRMPPYHADPSVGKFHDDKSLTPQQIKTLVHWIEAGAPRGEGEDPLAQVKFAAPEWPLGKPDLVLDIPAYEIPETGIVDYQRPAVAWPLTEGRWLRASTVKVEQRQGVHHILTGYMKEMPADGQGNESRWGASLGGYAVGAESTISPDDVGTYIPGGGAVGFQNHNTPFGKAATDRSKIAL